MSKIVVLIPAYNEEERIGKTIESIRKIESIDEIVVVDDGSQDSTEKKALELGVRVLRLDTNHGKGRALKKAILTLLSEGSVQDSDLLIFLDADTAETAFHIKELIEAAKSCGNSCFSLAVFPKPQKKGGFGLVKGIAFKFLKKKTGYEFKTPLSGQRAVFVRDVKKVLRAFDYGYGLEVAMSYLLCKNRVKPVEVFVKMSHRETGRSIKDFLHRGKQFLDVLKVIFDAYTGRLR